MSNSEPSRFHVIARGRTLYTSRLRRFREMYGISQFELAKRTGISTATISRIEQTEMEGEKAKRPLHLPIEYAWVIEDEFGFDYALLFKRRNDSTRGRENEPGESDVAQTEAKACPD